MAIQGLKPKQRTPHLNALCAIKCETRLADRPAEREALPEPAVAVVQ